MPGFDKLEAVCFFQQLFIVTPSIAVDISEDPISKLSLFQGTSTNSLLILEDSRRQITTSSSISRQPSSLMNALNDNKSVRPLSVRSLKSSSRAGLYIAQHISHRESLDFLPLFHRRISRLTPCSKQPVVHLLPARNLNSI